MTDISHPAETLVTLQNASVVFGGSIGEIGLLQKLTKWRDPVVALRDASLSVARGEVLGLVGESGSGKTTVGRLMLGLLKATSGTVTFAGDDIAQMGREALRQLRARLQMVYQDPLGSLDPRMLVGSSVAEPLRIHTDKDRSEARRAAIDALELVGLSPGVRFYNRYPNELSGGQQQRVGLARALITRPEALVLDEPLSSADVSIQVRLLDLLLKLRSELHLSYVFITHDLALARYICDRIVILYRGEIMEQGPTAAIFADPRHPYTQALINAVPARLKARSRTTGARLQTERGLAPPQGGCPLFGRCPIGVEGVCDVDRPALAALHEASNHEVACHYRHQTSQIASV
jgi:oligopeptide/dipeptide ABC transporter ATP-binding protein